MTQESTVLTDIAGYRDALELLEPADSEAEAIDRIRQLEELKATCAALQAEEAAALRVLRERHEAERGVAKARRCKGLAAEIGLARTESPNRGAQHLRLAQALVEDLPHTKRALRAGKIREEHAQVVVRETAWLEPAERQEVDGLLVDALGAVGVRKLEAQARAHAQRIDLAGAVQRLARAHAQRRVSVRPTAENMAYVTALLPMQQAVGVYASLRRDATTMVGTGETADPADPTGSPRTRDQIMADLFVERTTGQVTAAAVPAEVHVVMTDATLFGDSTTPAWLAGHGPIPARAVKQWLADPQMKVFLRRILARPEDHQLVRLESRSRLFPAGLRRMVMLRDDRCRAPFCDAPIQDIDHMHPVKNGGATSYQNASGLCARCNQTKENNLWHHSGGPDRLTVTTPTGHSYTAATPGLLTGRPSSAGPPDDKSAEPRSGPDEDPPEPRFADPESYRRTTPMLNCRIA